VIYDLPKVEALQIEAAHKQRFYRVERDRLKSRYFIYLNYPKINYHGLNLSEAKKYVYADFVARYERLIGRNVLFSIGYNNLDSSIYHSFNKLDKPLYNFCASQFTLYQKELKLLDISFDEEKEILFSNEEYIKFVQEVFLFLFDKGLISLKNDFVVCDEKRIYQKGEYYIKNNKYYSLNDEELQCIKRNHYVLKLATIKNSIEKELERINLPSTLKDALSKRFCYRNELEIKCFTNTYLELSINMENPEYICGISYICLNPNYIDIKPFITNDEGKDVDEFINNIKDGLFYTGTNLIIPIVNNQVPIFVSTHFDEAIHIGIPSLSDLEENFASLYELDFNPVIDYINGEAILVNSGRFNGLTLIEAREMISDYLISEGIAILHKELKLDEVIISSNIKFGVPIPLHVDESRAMVPVVYDLRHEVRLEDGELADRSLVKDFLSSDFVNFLLVNAIRLKNETGILDFTSMEALNEIGLFRNSELAIFESDNYATDIMYNIIFNCLFKKYYTSGFDCEFKDFLFVKPLLDINLRKMHRENNNLVSVSELLKDKGASVIRTYYAMIGCSDDVLYNEESIEEAMELIEKIIRVFYYPIDDACVDLDISYQRLIDCANIYAKSFDFKNYLESIITFIKKVHEVKHISRAQVRGLLILLSVITPSLAEQIKQDVLNLREPLYYYCWPE
jgi:leucyl-tRNA synthetase